jgi:2-desacetyl-2-hydroxyethyl bacteriochlorophyllide A dehydrogenase
MIGVLAPQGVPCLDRNLPDPRPTEGEALVRVRLAGICGTDRAVLEGYGGFSGILGHEFTGEVIEAPGSPGWVGTRVVGRITISCGGCDPCRQGRPGHCENRRVLGIRGSDGVFAEKVSIPAANLVAVPASVSDEAAVFAEPLAAAMRICEQVSFDPTDRILVIGAGTLGQLSARVLAALGCRPVVTARHRNQQRRLEAARISWIGEGEAAERSYDRVVEATGSPGGFAEALRRVRPEGVVVLNSSLREPVPVDLSALVVDEITVVGSRCGPMTAAVEWLAHGKIDPTDLIDARFPLAEAPAAFERAAAPGTMKVLLACQTADIRMS